MGGCIDSRAPTVWYLVFALSDWPSDAATGRHGPFSSKPTPPLSFRAVKLHPTTYCLSFSFRYSILFYSNIYPPPQPTFGRRLQSLFMPPRKRREPDETPSACPNRVSSSMHTVACIDPIANRSDLAYPGTTPKLTNQRIERRRRATKCSDSGPAGEKARTRSF